jgi:hypothetical protein
LADDDNLSGGEQPSADPKAGAEDAEIQERRLAQRFISAHAAVYNAFDTSST